MAQATNIPCTTLEKDLVVDSDVSGNLVIDGVVRIKGSLKITNASSINQLSSPRLATIDKEFHLEALTEIRSIEMTALTEIGSIDWKHLPGLNSIRLGQSGVTSATSVSISDTALSSLSEFKVSSVETMDINNNDRLTTYEGALANVTKTLKFSANGAGLVVSLPNLIWANDLNFVEVSEVDLPALQHINESIRFDQSSLTSFSAPNLTEVEKGDVAFVNNDEIANITFPSLTNIGGSLTLINNTALETVDGFPKLKEVFGAVLLGGNFQKYVYLPLTLPPPTPSANFPPAFPSLPLSAPRVTSSLPAPRKLPTRARSSRLLRVAKFVAATPAVARMTTPTTRAASPLVAAATAAAAPPTTTTTVPPASSLPTSSLSSPLVPLASSPSCKGVVG